MSRILLITCGNLTRLKYPPAPPLGLMYIASILRLRGHHLKILDMRLNDKGINLKRIIDDFAPDVVGLSAMTPESENMHTIATEVKNIDKNITVIAGGPHPTLYPEDTLNNWAIDFAVIGEGEETIVELISAINDGNNGYENIRGIYYRNNGKILGTPGREPIKDLDSLPFPSWDLINIDEYAKRLSMAIVGFRRYMGLFTSRACPYRCIYCPNIFGKKFRARTPENVVSEIEILVRDYKINDFEIYDDIFNFDRARAEKIMDLIIERKLNIMLSFPSGLRTDLLDYELLEKMKKAGVYYISIAVETASERLQKYIKKNLNLKKVNEIINYCAKLGIFTRGFFMLGFPTETEDEIKKTIRFAMKSRLHTAYFFIVTPFRGTELGNLVSNLEKIPFRDYDYFVGYFNLSNVSTKKLLFYQLVAELLVNYFNPFRIYLVLRDFKRKKYIPYLILRKILSYFRGLKRGI